MQNLVVIKCTVYDQIINLLLKKPKIEKVGLGFGIHERNEIKIQNFVSMINLDKSKVSFSLDYEVMFSEIQKHEKKNESFIGIFHSHPKEAKLYPSQKDLYFMQYWPYPYLWLIGKGSSPPRLSIFTLKNRKVLEIPFELKKS